MAANDIKIHEGVVNLGLDKAVCDACGNPIDVERLCVAWECDHKEKGPSGRQLIKSFYFYHHVKCVQTMDTKFGKLTTDGACWADWPQNPSPFSLLDYFCMFDFDNIADYYKMTRGLLSANFELWVKKGRCQPWFANQRAKTMANQTGKFAELSRLQAEGFLRSPWC